jgi:hypothetical protein
MTVAAQVPSQQIAAAAGQTVFPFAWRCDDSTTVVVYVNDALDGGFTVILNADQVAAPGGTITRAVPSVLGDLITVERVTPQTQTTALTKYGPFPASTITNALDRMVMLLQEVWAKVSRSVNFPRSILTKLLSFDLPAPQGGGTPFGWRTDDGGLHYYIANVPQLVIGVTQLATMVKNEVPAGLVNSTDGTDGNGVFTFAHVPASALLFDILIDGVRQPPNRYVRVGAVATFNAGFFPFAGSDIRADYFF